MLWLAGWLLLRAIGHGTKGWNALGALAGISFFGAIIPVPGVTAAFLLTLKDDFVLGAFGVLGAAIGSTAGATLMLALGHTGRAFLRKKATHSARARKMLEWSRKLAKKWTYVGVVVLLIPPFIPRAVVIYAAILAHLKHVPFLACVFVGTLLRNVLAFAALAWGWSFL